jgi:hypothetical protein
LQAESAAPQRRPLPYRNPSATIWAIEIQCPSGIVQALEHVPADLVLKIDEPQAGNNK